MTTGFGGGEEHPDEGPALILVVDDTLASRYIASSWLRRNGHQVIEAGTGSEALATLARWPVDLVVLDVGLPDMTGFDVCERIKSDPRMAQPVVHLSATSVRGEDRAQGLSRGADAYLVEPVDPGELLATVNTVLRNYRARAAAEGLADRLARLTKATLAMNSATDFKALVRAIATGAATIVNSPSVALVISPDGQLRRAVADPSAPVDATVDTVDTVPMRMLTDLAAPADGMSIGSVGLAPVEWRLVAPRPEVDGPALAAVFGSRGGQPLGIVLRAEVIAEESKELLAQLGHAAVLATDSLRLYTEEHTLALTLQRSFLTEPPESIAGLELGVRYVPAARNAEIGGDFYEFIELDDGQLLVAIGDVAGHSIHAATVMVELRHALRAYAIDDYGPAEILFRLERTLLRFHPREFSTLCILTIDRDKNRLHVANAGHLPPLLVEPHQARYLDVTGPWLGLDRYRAHDAVFDLPPIWSIVMITDGLIEKPGVDLDSALEELRTMASVEPSPNELCDRMLDHFAPDGRDDIGLLVLRRVG
jgi:serine phosphatase RsbU (regulator of sigma subunit)/DNA-binding NarL/FixJ family response regulator